MPLIFTVAKRGAVAGVAALAEAGGFGSIQGLACGELVAGTADVREGARLHETGEPCCGDTQRQRFCDAGVTKQLRLHSKNHGFHSGLEWTSTPTNHRLAVNIYTRKYIITITTRTPLGTRRKPR